MIKSVIKITHLKGGGTVMQWLALLPHSKRVCSAALVEVCTLLCLCLRSSDQCCFMQIYIFVFIINTQANQWLLKLQQILWDRFALWNVNTFTFWEIRLFASLQSVRWEIYTSWLAPHTWPMAVWSGRECRIDGFRKLQKSSDAAFPLITLSYTVCAEQQGH